MAYAVEKPGNRWELRESRSTASGPRSRTLVTFRELDEEAIAKATGRAHGPLDPEDARAACLRAGAPVLRPAPDRAATELLSELAQGRRPSASLSRVLRGALDDAPLGDAELAAAEWGAASAGRRGRALWDLLLLAGSIPAKKRAPRPELRFPPLRSPPVNP